MVEIAIPADAHTVENPENIEAEPFDRLRRIETEAGGTLYVSRVRARNYEVVETWLVTPENEQLYSGDRAMVYNIKTEHAYNYSSEEWEIIHEFDYTYDTTSDGGSLIHRPHLSIAQYCARWHEKTKTKRFIAFEFDESRSEVSV